VLVPLDPAPLSTDIYRYIWDGRVQAAGINPYLYLPVDRKLETLRDSSIYPNINRRDYAHTIYPPAAQIFFFAVTRITQSVIGFKGTILLVEIGTIILILLTLQSIGQPRSGCSHTPASAANLGIWSIWTHRRADDFLALPWLCTPVPVSASP